jgi:AbrB family looped-hinge helix DNA binding protein
MKLRIPIDKAGRVVLPKEVRERLHLVAGDLLEVRMDGQHVSLHPKRSAPARIIREGKRAVWDAPGEYATLAEIEASMIRGRDERDRRASGL